MIGGSSDFFLILLGHARVCRSVRYNESESEIILNIP